MCCEAIMGLHKLVLLLLFCTFCAKPSWSGEVPSPAIRMTVTEGILNKAKAAFIPRAVDMIKKLKIDDIQGEGSIDYKLSNITFVDVAEDPSKVTTKFDEGKQQLVLGVDGLAVKAEADFDVKSHKYPSIGTAGRLFISVVATATVGVNFPVCSEGNITLAVPSPASVKLKRLSITTSKTMLKWIYNAFLFIVKGVVKKKISDALSEKMNSAVEEEGGKLLEKIPFPSVPLVDGFSIDTRVSKPIYFGKNRMDVAIAGIDTEDSHAHTKAKHHEFPGDVWHAEKDLIVYVDDYLLNSVGAIAHEKGMLHKSLRDSDISEKSPLRLNTKTWEDIIPVLNEKFPETPMALDVVVSSEPEFSVGDKGLLGTISADMKFFVVKEDLIPVFMMKAALDVDVDEIKVDNSGAMPVVRGEANRLHFYNVAVTAEDAIGSVPIGTGDALEKILNLVAQSAGIGIINKLGEKGYTLPKIPNMKYDGAEVGFVENFIVFAISLVFEQQKDVPILI